MEVIGAKTFFRRTFRTSLGLPRYFTSASWNHYKPQDCFQKIIIVVCHHPAPYTWMSGPSEAPLHLQHSLFPMHPINPRISKYAKRNLEYRT